jgi:hypothetical protein
MKSVTRPTFVLALISMFVVATPSGAQIVIGGAKAGGNQSNRQEEENQSSMQGPSQSGRRPRTSSQPGGQPGNSTSQQIQQMLLQGQGGQNQNFPGGSNRAQRNQNQLHGIQIEQGQLPTGRRSEGNLGNWQGNQWRGSRNAKNWIQYYGGEAQPFSSQWYQAHPKAWRYDNNRANVWVVGSLPGLYGWLGWGESPAEYRVNYGGGSPQIDPRHYGNWYPLGVYSLMAGPDDLGTRMVQLAVDRNGQIAGNYYDLITNSNYSVSGDISRQSQRVAWLLNKNRGIRFRTHISQLMQPYGMMTVRMPGGEQQWQFVRLED